MTICIATSEYLPTTGGIATFYSKLIPMLTAHNNHVILLTVDVDNAQSKDSITVESNTTRVTLRESFNRHHIHYRKIIHEGSRQAATICAIGMAMKDWLLANTVSHGIEVIETVDVSGFGAFLVDEILPSLVVCGHGALFQRIAYDYIEPDQNMRIIIYLERLSLYHSDLVITHSYRNQQDLADACKTTIHFCSAPWQHDMQVSVQPADIGINALVAGRLQSFKGVKVMADALRKSFHQKNNISVTWIGDDTYTAPSGYTWTKYLQKYYADIWQKNFIWLPAKPRNELLKLLQSAKMIIIPSLWDAFNFITIEAASMKKPIIISDGVGAAYLFKNKENALVIPAGDPDALLAAILQLSADNDLQKRLSEKVSEPVVNNLTIQKTVSERIAAYELAIDNRKKDR